MNKVYRIKDIETYGKFVAYLIEKDISVWRLYWDERKKDRCFRIDWEQRNCSYASEQFYVCEKLKVVDPVFELNEYGVYQLKN